MAAGLRLHGGGEVSRRHLLKDLDPLSNFPFFAGA
jgi:hypothetical protein